MVLTFNWLLLWFCFNDKKIKSGIFEKIILHQTMSVLSLLTFGTGHKSWRQRYFIWWFVYPSEWLIQRNAKLKIQKSNVNCSYHGQLAGVRQQCIVYNTYYINLCVIIYFALLSWMSAGNPFIFTLLLVVC